MHSYIPEQPIDPPEIPIPPCCENCERERCLQELGECPELKRLEEEDRQRFQEEAESQYQDFQEINQAFHEQMEKQIENDKEWNSIKEN